MAKAKVLVRSNDLMKQSVISSFIELCAQIRIMDEIKKWRSLPLSTLPTEEQICQ